MFLSGLASQNFVQVPCYNKKRNQNSNPSPPLPLPVKLRYGGGGGVEIIIGTGIFASTICIYYLSDRHSEMCA